MSDNVCNLLVRIAVLEAELAGAAGIVAAVAEHFEKQGEDGLANYLHAWLRKRARCLVRCAS